MVKPETGREDFEHFLGNLWGVQKPGTGQGDVEQFHPSQLSSAPSAGATGQQESQANNSENVVKDHASMQRSPASLSKMSP